MINESAFAFAFTPDWNGRDNMDVDSYLCRNSILKRPLMRLYTWSRPTISLGHNQNIEKRINMGKCADDGIDVVFRPTGGRELLHGHDICYSIIWPLRETVNSLKAREYFNLASGILTGALHEFGIEAACSDIQNRGGVSKGPCFAQIDSGEISFKGKKLIASAQRVFESAILQQGSMPLAKPSADIVDYLNYKGDLKGLKEKLDSMTILFYDILENRPSVAEIAAGFRDGLESKIGVKTQEIKVGKNNFDFELSI
jgi:lipoate-protein ligase A